MRQLLLRATGAAALAGALAFGTLTAFAAEGTAGAADSPNVLPAGSIAQTAAQTDALQGYPAGSTAVFDGVNDANGVITYGFTVTAAGTAYDVQVNALTGAVVQKDAAGTDTAETAGAAGTTMAADIKAGAASAEGGETATAEADGPGGPNLQQGGNVQQNGNF